MGLFVGGPLLSEDHSMSTSAVGYLVCCHLAVQTSAGLCELCLCVREESYEAGQNFDGQQMVMPAWDGHKSEVESHTWMLKHSQSCQEKFQQKLI